MTERPGQNASDYPEVLIISSDLGLTRFLSEGLLPAGFWPSAVRSGLQALEVFRLRTFDAVLIDAALSDLPVDALVERLRETHDEAGEEVRHTSTTSMVIIAGIQQELEPYDLEVIAPDAVFVAPFDLEDLVDRLNQV
ncbi:MAG: response regulator transcription factor [Thermomicrobiales bacterium]|nr:response regulator transcription factor [Thermomicrobiales bacterium]